MRFSLILLHILLGFTAFADCPNLSGNFLCPAYGPTQPASPMTVTQTETNGVTTYVYAFPNLGTSSSSASSDGLIEDNLLKFCDNDKLYLGEIAGDHAGEVQTHFIDAQGNYVVLIQGKIVQDCVRQ
jgi:hypothetical protein